MPPLIIPHIRPSIFWLLMKKCFMALSHPPHGQHSKPELAWPQNPTQRAKKTVGQAHPKQANELVQDTNGPRKEINYLRFTARDDERRKAHSATCSVREPHRRRRNQNHRILLHPAPVRIRLQGLQILSPAIRGNYADTVVQPVPAHKVASR